MHKRSFLWVKASILALALCLTPDLVFANGQVVTLPAPDTSGGRPLMACLKDRKSERHFATDDISLPELSSLLWAAWGVNRADGRHVIPTARNEQKVRLLVVLGDGVWQYLPEKNSIEKVMDGDQRKRFDNASLILLYAAPAGELFSGMHVGSMYQNVALYCASEGLPNCVKYSRHDALGSELKLPKGWKVLITQSVGSKHSR
ncbi:MAG: nitroreductase family protein [Desulfovibrio sp.]|nr:nitroreductase family protein [Desulfovibrio sp.]